MMSMSEEKGLINPEKTRVLEWIKLLKAVEQFLEQIGKHENLVTSIRELRAALKPFEKCQYKEVLDLLKPGNETKGDLSTKVSILDGLNLEELSLNKLKILALNDSVSKNELLLLADKTLKMPTGTLKRMNKETIRQKILNVIQNSEKLDTIGRQAAK